MLRLRSYFCSLTIEISASSRTVSRTVSQNLSKFKQQANSFSKVIFVASSNKSELWTTYFFFFVIRRVHCIKNCLTLLYVKGVLKPTPPQAAPSDAFQSGPNGFKFLETNSLLRAYFLKNLFWPTVSTSPRSIVSFHNRERWWSHTARKRMSSEDYFCTVLPFAHYARI